MEVETAIRRHLLSLDGVKGYVGPDGVYKYSLLNHVEGTGGRAIVVRRSNGWGVPDPVQSSEYPIVMLDFWADPDRVDGEKVADNAVDKAFAVYRVVDKLLHGKRGVIWGGDGGLFVISSSRYAEPFYETAGDSHGGKPDIMTPIGDTAVVTAQYALHIVH